MHRYEFCEENKEYFLHFLDVSKTANKYCNLTEHDKFQKLFPRNGHFQNIYKNVVKKCETIDLTESDEDIVNISDDSQVPLQDLEAHVLVLNCSTFDDTLHSIKESLQTNKQLSSSALEDLNNLRNNQWEIYHSLSEDLNLEEVLHFGLSLKTANIYNEILPCYIRFLLIKQLTLEYSDQLQDLLNYYSIRFSETLMEELSQVLLDKSIYSKTFLQFIDGLNMDFKQKLLRKFIMACEKLEECHIPVLEVLVTTHLEVETVSKLFEKLSNTDNFSTNKSFGKLLITIIKTLGRNVVLLEQALKHVIGSHKSIWKSKLQKSFDDCLQESSMLSQSFRC